ncbi:MAG: hypothetical protein K2X41_09145 [Hyphomicrobium sp.]|nr:hypothetical protein [Hyphomicrobium sp.]
MMRSTPNAEAVLRPKTIKATAATAITIAAIAGASPALLAGGSVQDDASLTIEDVIADGWEVAGYASNFDARSTFILFKKPGARYLIQCLAGYDVTRQPRVFRNCYELR